MGRAFYKFITTAKDCAAMERNRFPEGTWLAIGLTLGCVIGIPIGNIGIGIGIVFEYYFGNLFKE